MLKKNAIFILFLILSVAYTYTDYHSSQTNKEVRVDKAAVNNYLHHTLEIVHPEAFENFQTGLDKQTQQALINNLINDEILYEYGMRKRFAENDGDIKQIVIGKAQNDIEMELLSEIDISNDQVYAYYSSNIDDYVSPETISLELINLIDSSEQTVGAALRAIDNGQSAKEISTLANMPNLMRNTDPQRLDLVFGPEVRQQLFEQARAGQLNRWQQGFTTKQGYHLYRLSQYQEAQPIPFNHVKQSVAQELLMDELRTAYDARLADKRQAFEVTIELDQGGNDAS
ncbi:peptidyl-prolyl cis-trans isomerase [Vibrio superstes]|uniref:peptidylprolyl isomerase n=1 Tax=Vibrio superstes NBRC 103154 TaxID=1219062 RepID=A0A511QXQ2_9VIBR|nr:peptidylprolyl isomerase [Vibrio superstes]GEM81312.1 hypothetical protein VSU01S_35570 [Vibrio superstes NBRC 103154]